jgi:hypothetical protein
VAEPVHRIEASAACRRGAPTVTMISQPVLRATEMTSSQNVRQWRFGSTPSSSTMSRDPSTALPAEAERRPRPSARRRRPTPPSAATPGSRRTPRRPSAQRAGHSSRAATAPRRSRRRRRRSTRERRNQRVGAVSVPRSTGRSPRHPMSRSWRLRRRAARPARCSPGCPARGRSAHDAGVATA